VTRDDMPALAFVAAVTIVIVLVFAVAALSGTPFGGL